MFAARHASSIPRTYVGNNSLARAARARGVVRAPGGDGRRLNRARPRAFFEDQDVEDLSPTTSVTATPDAWTAGTFTKLDDSCVMFGVSHLSTEGAHDAAEFILKTKPSLVVVETAVTSEHGDATGNVLQYEQGVSAMMMDAAAADEALIFVTRLAGMLLGELGPIEESPQWENMKAQLPPEVLVYAAAFAVRATIVYGDRPKAVTIKRLVSTPTLGELDGAFAAQSERNYRLLLPDDHPLAAAASERTNDYFEKVIIDERDCVLASTIRECVNKAENGGKVVAVMGVDHVAGVARIYGDTFGAAENDAKIDELTSVPTASSESLGARLAMAQRLMGLRCPPALLNDVERTLEEDVANLTDEEKANFELVSEVYGSTRMLMACVKDEAVLDTVIGGYKCDYSKDVLEPVRAVRPANGGKGWSDEIINALRTNSVANFPAKGGASAA
jgi:hypothetical protein